MRSGGRIIMAAAIGTAAALPSLAAFRCFTAEYAHGRVERALAERQPVAIVDAWVRRAKRVAPEYGAPLGLRGQAFALWAVQEGGGVGTAIAGLAAADLAAATRLTPAEPAIFTASAQAAGAAGEASLSGRYAYEAVVRRPGFAEYAWAWARAVPRSAPERRRAYRAVTQLAPQLTPRVLDEAAPGEPLDHRRRYVAPSAAAYRAWAWSVTDTAQALHVARWGLALPPRQGDERERGFLAYLVGLRTEERSPGEALFWYRRAVAVLADEQAVQRNYGFALLKTGDAAGAVRAFEASLRLQPGLTNPAYLGLGQAHEALGRNAEALEIFRRLQRQPHIEAWIRRQAGDAVYRLERKG